jgi:ABC-type transport system involved in multi-copper enzyme maturation permease subunit
VTNALRIAWREIRWEIFGDRSAAVRMGIFVIMPMIFVLTNRSARTGEIGILILALESALFPALSGVALIASTFTQEKENGTIIPLLASPIRDMDIVVGKLLGMLIPVFGLCIATEAVFYVLAASQFGLAKVQAALPPEVIFGLLIVSLLYLLTAGSWVLIVAALVKTSRAGQQVAGLLIGISIAVFAGLGAVASQVGGGWPLLVFGAALVLSDALAIEIAQRVWRREEVLARL